MNGQKIYLATPKAFEGVRAGTEYVVEEKNGIGIAYVPHDDPMMGVVLGWAREIERLRKALADRDNQLAEANTKLQEERNKVNTAMNAAAMAQNEQQAFVAYSHRHSQRR